ncbi:MAG TPA: YceI family protein [Ohtaekwangia sp.]|nr:YceI family protein [Ohtaekwangia sp.]
MTTATATKTKWNLDPTHSEIGFKVKHMMITNVSGSFKTFDVKTETVGTDFTTATIEFTADVNTISTGSTDRDNHLKSADFFDAAAHPELKFVSTKFEKKDEENYSLQGDLTIHGVSKPVTFKVEFGGVGKDPWGNEKAGFTITGKINRTDFNLNWNAALETGGVLVSDEVRLFAEIQLVKAA